MSDQISDEARRDVNNAIVSAGSATVTQLVEAGRSSQFKREEARQRREEEARKKKETEQLRKKKEEEEES